MSWIFFVWLYVEVKVHLWRGWMKEGGCQAAVTSSSDDPPLHPSITSFLSLLWNRSPACPHSLPPSLIPVPSTLTILTSSVLPPSLSPTSSPLSHHSSDLSAFLSLHLFFFSLLFLPLLPFIKCGWWLTGSCWLASGGGYSFIIPLRLPDRLATMSQELNICHYYLLVLFDFEAAQWPDSGGFILPPSVVRFKVDYSNPWAPDSTKSWCFLSFPHSFYFLSLVPPPRFTL